MEPPPAVVVAKFPQLGEGLKTLKSLHIGELVLSGKFDFCTLNDGKPLETICSSCLKTDAKVKCSCAMTSYCSDSCQKKDHVLHELECSFAQKLQLVSKTPTRSQRLLLRYLKSGLNADINCDYESFDKGLVEYLMFGIAVIKKYLPAISNDPKDLLIKSLQLKCSCFEIDEIGIGYSDVLKKINHSCDPNLIAQFSQNNVMLFATKNIKKDDQLTISYVDDSSILPQFYNFDCKCGKCRK